MSDRGKVKQPETTSSASDARDCSTEFVVEGEYPTWNEWMEHGSKMKTLKDAQILIKELNEIDGRKYRIKKMTITTEIL